MTPTLRVLALLRYLTKNYSTKYRQYIETVSKDELTSSILKYHLEEEEDIYTNIRLQQHNHAPQASGRAATAMSFP